MKVKELIQDLYQFDTDLEVRVMDITKEETDDITYCPTFEFDVEEMISDANKKKFIAISFNPED